VTDRVPAPLTIAARAAAIAQEAGALLRRYFDRGVATEYKGDVDLVTEADRASERLITERLTAAFPEHGIYGEEGVRERVESEYRWYVDPLDGTTNFAHTFPVFCVSLGLEHRPPDRAPGSDGVLVAGVIYDPTRDDLFVAEKDQGAWLNGRRIHVSGTKHLAEALLATGFPSRKRHVSPNIHFYQEFTLRSHGVRRAGSAALDLAYTACGRLDGFWEFHLNPWDTAAGALLVMEAGGSMSRFNGEPFRLDSGEVLATNGLLQDELTHLFQNMFAGRELRPIPTPAEFAAARVARTAGGS
jgi:myo-inositol-1(or 4)-monophosphatase